MCAFRFNDLSVYAYEPCRDERVHQLPAVTTRHSSSNENAFAILEKKTAVEGICLKERLLHVGMLRVPVLIHKANPVVMPRRGLNDLVHISANRWKWSSFGKTGPTLYVQLCQLDAAQQCWHMHMYVYTQNADAPRQRTGFV